MSLAPGSSLSHYAIVGPLGAGAMGEVYRARDTKLGREVAIKVLPEHFAADEERLRRFEREAKTLASLNHPNVAQIHGVDQVGDTCFLVLELVPGESLEERLKRGPLPLDEALDVCRQIAEGLEAAHEAGVIHRDLKPANVRVTPEGRVKVLDFGLAKPARLASGAGSSTDSVLSTEAGRLLGTPTYMAPEQARGKGIDRRVDVWAFGCVLYECLTARRAFAGETLTDVLAAVLEREPDWQRLPANLPASVRELLASCFTKDAHARLRDIGDARLGLERARRGDGGARSVAPSSWCRRELVAWSLAVVASGIVVWLWTSRPEPPAGPRGEVVRFQVSAPGGTELDAESVNAAISPDGRRLAFLAGERGAQKRIWIRDLGSASARPLEGTEGAEMPFWSPDDEAVAFFAAGRLARVAIQGGAVQTLCAAPAPRGGDWSPSGVIVFAPFSNGPLHAVPQSGGTSTAVTALDPGHEEAGHRFPQFLPGGRTFLYSSLRAAPGTVETRLASLDSPESRALIVADSRATFAPPDWLLFARDGLISAQRFDLGSGALIGTARPTGIQASGATNYGGHHMLTCSRTGRVLSPVEGERRTRLVELDARGERLRELALEPDYYTSATYSHAGERALLLLERSLGSELRLADLGRGGVWSRLTDDRFVRQPIWSPDDAWVYYSSDRETRDLFRCRTAGAGLPELVLESGNLFAHVKDIAPDGKSLIINMLDPSNGRDLWVVELESKTSRPLLDGPGNEFDARFSPDGKWLAYASDESGRAELYVQDHPDVHTRVRVSSAGLGSAETGTPSSALIHWSPDGNELVYLAPDRRGVIAVAVTREPSFQVGTARKLFDLPQDTVNAALSPDGQRCLALLPDPGQPPCALAITLDWLAELEPAR
ncbi:MAG TPA: protein kinase [Planctomycetota bacterium]